jgi:hypothetical protein
VAERSEAGVVAHKPFRKNAFREMASKSTTPAALCAATLLTRRGLRLLHLLPFFSQPL